MTAATAVMVEDGLFAPGRRAVSAAAVALISMLAFEAMAVTAAMPAIAAALDGLDRYALAFGATLAMSVPGMVIAGIDSDRRGPARSMAGGLLAFAAGLLLAGLASDMRALLAGRVLQGLGSGALGVALYVTVGRLYPAVLRPRLFAMFAAAWVLPALLGPALAALLLAVFGWRAVFLVVLAVLPLAAVAVLPAAWRLGAPARPAGEARAGRRVGLALLAALAALALHAHASDAQASPAWQAWAAVGVLALACQGLLPAGALRAARGLPTVVTLRGLLAGAFFAAEAFVPLWLSLRHGWSTGAAGLALSAGAVLWSVGSQLQARVADPRRRQRVLGAGLLLLTLALVALALLAALQRAPALAVLAWMLAGLGVGLAFPTLSVLLLALSPEAEQGRNSSALQLADALATTAALALAGTLFVGLRAAHADGAFAAVFAAAAALAALAWMACGRTRPPAAA